MLYQGVSKKQLSCRPSRVTTTVHWDWGQIEKWKCAVCVAVLGLLDSNAWLRVAVRQDPEVCNGKVSQTWPEHADIASVWVTSKVLQLGDVDALLSLAPSLTFFPSHLA